MAPWGAFSWAKAGCRSRRQDQAQDDHSRLIHDRRSYRWINDRWNRSGIDRSRLEIGMIQTLIRSVARPGDSRKSRPGGPAKMRTLSMMRRLSDVRRGFLPAFGVLATAVLLMGADEAKQTVDAKGPDVRGP